MIGEILIFDFLKNKHVVRPHEAKKPVFKKKAVCVCVCMYDCNRIYVGLYQPLWNKMFINNN